MKSYVVLPLMAAALLAAGCRTGVQEFVSQDGTVRATVKEGTNKWTITDAEGREPVADYDSMRVVEVGQSGHPATVVYYKGAEQHIIQYFSTMRLRSDGVTVNGKREGRWVFYHPNGVVQCEATFVNGKEEGPYRVYRDNGAPYYIGYYTAGTPSGLWEVYDPEGNLVEKTEY